MYLRMKEGQKYIMNRICCILLFLLVPILANSQSRELKELYVYVQAEKGNYHEAIDSLDKLINYENNDELLLLKAGILAKQKLYSQAITYADNLDKSSFGKGSELKLKIYLEQDDYDNAEKALKINLNSRYKISLFKLLNSPEYNKLQGSELIDQILQSTIYSKTEKQLYQVERLIQAEKYEQAQFVIDEILNRNSQVSDAYYFKSRIESVNGFNRQALDQVNIALSLKTNPTYFAQRAELYIKLEKYSQALLDINKLIKQLPGNFDNYVLQAKLNMLNGEYEKAVLITDQLIDLNLKNTDLLYVNGKSHFELGNNLQALKSISKLLDIQPSKEAFELRGDIYMQSKTYEFAEKDYSMFLDMEPYNGDIYAKKGLARYFKGDRKGACSDWQKAIRYGSYDAVKYQEKYCK